MKPRNKLGMNGGFAIGPHHFYTGIVPIVDIESDDEMITFPRSKGRVLCLVQNYDYVTMKKKDLDIPLNLITPRQVGSKDIILMSNQWGC
jgi:hypothetical protein